MASLTVIRDVHAPIDVVFDTIADPRKFADAIGGVKQLEVDGNRYRQTRVVGGKESTMDFEVTESVKNDHVRIVNITHGTLWDSIFTVGRTIDGTKLMMRMEASGGPILARILMPLIMIMIRKAVAKDIDAIKRACDAPRH